MPDVLHTRTALTMWVLVAALVGCASVVQTKVTNFNAWPADAPGSTYSYVRASDVQRAELEQSTYEGYVGVELEKQGLRQAAPGVAGQFLVEVRASDSTRQRIVLEPVYDNQLIYVAPTRDRYGNVYPGYWQPDRFGPRYIGDREVTRTVQVNRLDVRMCDARANDGDPRPVFNATAVYEGDNEDLPDIVPFLARAIFHGFPGRNGRVDVLRFDEATGKLLTR